MNMPQETNLMTAYIQNVSSSRSTMNNMLTILAQQDRNMQSIIVMSHHINRQANQRNTSDNGTHFPGFSNTVNNSPQFNHNNRRGNVPSNIGRLPRTSANENYDRLRRAEAYNTPAGHYVRRFHTPFSTSIPTVETPTGLPPAQPMNRPFQRPVNMPAHPPWLNAALNNFDPLIPVVVRPTESEIDVATEEVRFGIVSGPVNSVCPITRERFSENDRVMQIIHCGHNFNPPSLRHWFQTSVRCPLCRYDIREYDPTEAIRNPYRTPSHRVTSDTPTDTGTEERNTANNTGVEERNAAETLGSLDPSDRSGTGNVVVESPHQERTLQVNVSDRANVVSSIASYISRDIMAQLDSIPIDSSGNVLLEYSFGNHMTATGNSQQGRSDPSSTTG